MRPHKILVSIADITSNPHHFKIKEIASEHISRMIEDVDAAVVNNDFAGPAGLGKKNKQFLSNR